jgi:hypothetical protein
MRSFAVLASRKPEMFFPGIKSCYSDELHGLEDGHGTCSDFNCREDAANTANLFGGKRRAMARGRR